MKTKLSRMLALTVMAFVVIVITSSKKSRAAELSSSKVTEFSDVKHINKIVISGNVEVFLSQGESENLKVYDSYFSKNALVQWTDGTLRISSYEKEKLTVFLTVTDLSSVEASGNANIRTLNKLSGIDLSIKLAEGAKASIEARVINLSTDIADTSKLELTGDAESQHISLSGLAQYESSGFTAVTRSVSISDDAIASFSQDGKNTIIQASAPSRQAEEMTPEIVY